jgi:hypothetical protein
MSNFYRGVIDPKWAEWVAKQGVKIWEYNGFSTELIDTQIDLSSLGTLALNFSGELYSKTEIAKNSGSRKLANLAFESYSRVTQSYLLRHAALERGGLEDKLYTEIVELEKTNGYDMLWAIPRAAIMPGIPLDDVDFTTLHNVQNFSDTQNG